MSSEGFTIVHEDIDNEQVKNELVRYLSPHEENALFLLGNIESHYRPSFHYVARKKGRIVAVCGYYLTFQSCAIFSEDPEASRFLAKVVLKSHPEVCAVLGMATMVMPAYDEFLAQGRIPLSSPETLFFELSMEDFTFFSSSEGVVRKKRESDIDTIARLLRIIHHPSMNGPVTEEERAKVRASPVLFCLEVDGKVVSVASSNGLAIKAFQILGVATDPAYQGRGYAKAVCSHLIRSMQEQGAEKAIIFTGEENIAAKKCYLDLGFQITDRYYVGLFEPKKTEVTER